MRCNQYYATACFSSSFPNDWCTYTWQTHILLGTISMTQKGMLDILMATTLSSLWWTFILHIPKDQRIATALGGVTWWSVGVWHIVEWSLSSHRNNAFRLKNGCTSGYAPWPRVVNIRGPTVERVSTTSSFSFINCRPVRGDVRKRSTTQKKNWAAWSVNIFGWNKSGDSSTGSPHIYIYPPIQSNSDALQMCLCCTASLHWYWLQQRVARIFARNWYWRVPPKLHPRCQRRNCKRVGRVCKD